jgi:hypothetical protein
MIGGLGSRLQVDRQDYVRRVSGVWTLTVDTNPPPPPALHMYDTFFNDITWPGRDPEPCLPVSLPLARQLIPGSLVSLQEDRFNIRDD